MFHNRRVLGAVSRPFVGSAAVPPNTIFGANLKGWWAADNPGGALVEKSGTLAIGGGNLNLTAIGTTAPTVDATGINGYPAYKFVNTGGGTGLLSATGILTDSVFPTLGAAGALFAVVKATSNNTTGVPRFFSMDANEADTATQFSWTGYISTSTLAYRGIANTIGMSVTNTWTAGENAILIWTFGGGNLTVYKNNVQIDTCAPGTLNIGGNLPGTGFFLGNFRSQTGAIDGWIGEVFVVNVAPTIQQRLDSYQWLKTRFGL